MAKKKIVNAEGLKNVKKSISKLSKSQQDVAKKLLSEISFCTNTLEKLKEEVNIEGVLIDMPQGNYSIRIENPALKSYNTTIKNYQNLFKQLTELFADVPKEDLPDELEAFCK